MPTIQVNGLSYFYQTQGSGSALVLLHGFTGSSDTWSEFVEPLSKQFQVVRIDLPGHGRSAAPSAIERYTMESVSQDLVAVFQALRIPSTNLLGYSMGGRLALYMAIQHPSYVKSLIIESASPGLKTSNERQMRIKNDRRLAAEIEQDGIRTFVERWQRMPLFETQQRLPQERQESLYRQRLNNSVSGLANSLRGMGTGRQPSLWSKLDSIQLPVLILAGDLDIKYAHIARQVAAIIPNSTEEIFTNAGHNIHHEKPKRFSATIMSFLTDLEKLSHAKKQDEEQSHKRKLFE